MEKMAAMPGEQATRPLIRSEVKERTRGQNGGRTLMNGSLEPWGEIKGKCPYRLFPGCRACMDRNCGCGQETALRTFPQLSRFMLSIMTVKLLNCGDRCSNRPNFRGGSWSSIYIPAGLNVSVKVIIKNHIKKLIKARR